MKTPLFTGSSAAIVTPFRDGRVDLDALGRIIDMQKLAGTAALTVCGTTGEAATMAPEERRQVISYCVERRGGMKIIAGTGSNDTGAALDQSKSAADLGVDGVLVVTPYYNRPTQAGLIAHYARIADNVDVPVILYNVPGRTGVSVAPETVLELSRHPNINGIKEASGSTGLTSFIMSTCPEDMNVWSGNDSETLPLMSLGAVGVISVAANILPEVMRDLTRLCLEGDFQAASRLHAEYFALFRALFTETNPIPVKTALSAMGLCREDLRLPLTPMSPDRRRQLLDTLRRYGII